MEEVFAKFQLLRRIAGANNATQCQRYSHLRICTSSDLSCKATINSFNRTAPSLHRSVPNGGRTPRCTIPTRRTSAESSPTRSELKTILLDALSTSRLGAYKNLYQQYCNRSHNGKTYTDLYNDIHDLIKYDSDGVKSSTRDSDAEIEDSDGSRSTRASSRSSNSHSSRRQAQIQHAASVRQAQQLASNTSANSNINYQSSNTGGGSPSNGTREPCKNCKSTSHGTKWCPSPKYYEKNCGKTFASADERKAHFIQKHGFTSSKPTTPPLKSSLKDGKGNKVKFVKSQRLVGKVHRVQTKAPKRQPANDSEDDSNSSIGSDSSMSVEAAPRALIWKNDTSSSKKGRKVSHLRNVSTTHSMRKSKRLSEKRDNDKPDAKASSEPDAVVPPPAGQPVQAAPSTSSDVNIDSVAPDTTTSRHSGDEAPQRRGVPRVQPRGTKTTIRGRIQVHPSSQPTRSRV